MGEERERSARAPYELGRREPWQGPPPGRAAAEVEELEASSVEPRREPACGVHPKDGATLAASRPAALALDDQGQLAPLVGERVVLAGSYRKGAFAPTRLISPKPLAQQEITVAQNSLGEFVMVTPSGDVLIENGIRPFNTLTTIKRLYGLGYRRLVVKGWAYPAEARVRIREVLVMARAPLKDPMTRKVEILPDELLSLKLVMENGAVLVARVGDTAHDALVARDTQLRFLFAPVEGMTHALEGR